MWKNEHLRNLITICSILDETSIMLLAFGHAVNTNFEITWGITGRRVARSTLLVALVVKRSICLMSIYTRARILVRHIVSLCAAIRNFKIDINTCYSLLGTRFRKKKRSLSENSSIMCFKKAQNKASITFDAFSKSAYVCVVIQMLLFVSTFMPCLVIWEWPCFISKCNKIINNLEANELCSFISWIFPFIWKFSIQWQF